MKKLLTIGLVITVTCGTLCGCIGEDEPETKVTVRRIKMSEEDETEIPPHTPSQPEGGPVTSGDSPQSPPQSPTSPRTLEEATPEEEEKAIEIAQGDERVQDLISGSDYELEVMGCMTSPDGGTRCLLSLELENGEKYTIIINMDESIVEEIREGEGPQPGGQNNKGGG